jgi:hypothetical protein
MVPGVITNVNDPAAGTVTTQFPIHGGRANESRMWVDGLNVGNPPGGGQPPTYVADIGNAQEIAFTTSGGLGESETAGLVMNVVPKTGGNQVHGAVFYSGTGEKLQADNGSGVPRLNNVYDLNISIGGPVMKEQQDSWANWTSGLTSAATPAAATGSPPAGAQAARNGTLSAMAATAHRIPANRRALHRMIAPLRQAWADGHWGIRGMARESSESGQTTENPWRIRTERTSEPSGGTPCWGRSTT